MRIQNNPVADSPNNDAFEALVETYYQTQGYITSAGKWFWVWADGKQQRGHRDIDVLAIKGDKTVIVSVTSNLDDKVNIPRGGSVNLDKASGYFSLVQAYLNNVAEYQWIVKEGREINHVIAYSHAYQRTLEPIKAALDESQIELISSDEMLKSLKSLKSHTLQPNLKIQNPLLRTIQLLKTEIP